MEFYSLDKKPFDANFPFNFGKAVLHDQGFNIHGHHYSELVIIASGRGVHQIEKIAYPVQTGDIFVIHQGMKHGFINCRDLTMYNLGFMASQGMRDILSSVPGIKTLFELEPQVRASGDFKSRLHASPLQMDQIRDNLTRMEGETNDKKPGYKQIFTNLFYNLIIFLGRYYSDTSYSPGKKLIRFTSCIEELEKNFDQPLNIGKLAGKHGYTSAHLIRSFKKIYGVTPLQYIIQLRLNKAMELLQNRNMNISEIAFTCGFEDSNYFSRLFRKRTGMSPGEFRSTI